MGAKGAFAPQIFPDVGPFWIRGSQVRRTTKSENVLHLNLTKKSNEILVKIFFLLFFDWSSVFTYVKTF